MKAFLVRTVIAITVLFCVTFPAMAQDGQPYALDGTQVWSVPDPTSGRQYDVSVSLPANYDSQPEHRYAVLYITDANYGFPLIRSIVHRINIEGPVTEDFIFVGLSYAKNEDPMASRRRDYTLVARDDGSGGGGPAYQAYLRNTVLPFIESKFRTDPHRRAFMGHSYGALLGAQILLTDPTMFEGYILGSPSLWYANHAIFDLETAAAKSRRAIPAHVYMYVGAYEAVKLGDPRYNQTEDMVKDNAAFAARLKSRSYKGLSITSEVIPSENHLTVFPTGFTRGIVQILPARK